MHIKAKKESLKYKLIRGFIQITIILILVYAIYIFQSYNYFLKYEEEKINIYNKSVSLNINNDIKNIITDINSLTFEEDFKNWNLYAMQKFSLLYLKKNNLIIDGLYLINSKGIVSMNFPGNKDVFDKNVSQFDFYSRVMKEKKFIINDNFINNKLLISMSFPVFGESYDEIVGMIVVFLNLSNRNEDIFNNIIDPNTYQWQILLVNNQGYLLYHSHKKIENLSIAEIDYSKNPAVKNALSGKWELNDVKIQNEIMYTSSEMIPLTEWYVIVLVPRNLIIGNILKIIIPNLTLFVFLLIIFLIFIWFGANLLINPITKLTNAIKEYGEKGSMNLLIVKGNDEVSEAIKTFNNMVMERKEIDREILQIIERERKRIGKEIHDDLEKILNGIYNQYLIIREELNTVLKIENFYILSYLEKISKLLNQAIYKTRSISNGLWPVNFYEGGFIKSIKELITNYQKAYSVEIILKFEEDIDINDELVLINLYYIIHEAINNSSKNNKARNIEINMFKEYNNLIVSIIDNGEKIPESPESKMSEKIINYNARLINAELKAESTGDKNIMVCKLNDYSSIK